MAKRSDGAVALWLGLCRAFDLEPNDIIELTLRRLRDGSMTAEAVHVEIKDGQALDGQAKRYRIVEVDDGN